MGLPDETMQDERLPCPIAVTLDVTLKELLAGYAFERDLERKEEGLKRVGEAAPRGRALARFLIGCCLGYFHLNLAGVVVFAAAVALGFWPQVRPDGAAFLRIGSIVAGSIWLWVLAAPALAKFRYMHSLAKELRPSVPEIFAGPVPARVCFAPDMVTAELLGARSSAAPPASLRLVETADYFFLRVRLTLVPMAKARLAAADAATMRDWARSQGVLYYPRFHRRSLLPPPFSAAAGLALFVMCLAIAGGVRREPEIAAYPARVTVGLSDGETVVDGETAKLDHLYYTVSMFQEGLYEQLRGAVSGPDVSGTFREDRNAHGYLAQTAEDEFAEERGWNFPMGPIPQSAMMEALLDSSVLISWQNPRDAAYPGQCVSLRANVDTVKLNAGRVMWRRRLYVTTCSATLSAQELRAWMLAAIGKLDAHFLLWAHGDS
jgi:hypothetical protein